MAALYPHLHVLPEPIHFVNMQLFVVYDEGGKLIAFVYSHHSESLWELFNRISREFLFECFGERDCVKNCRCCNDEGYLYDIMPIIVDLMKITRLFDVKEQEIGPIFRLVK